MSYPIWEPIVAGSMRDSVTDGTVLWSPARRKAATRHCSVKLPDHVGSPDNAEPRLHAAAPPRRRCSAKMCCGAHDAFLGARGARAQRRICCLRG
jgi:hypothetical protein